MAALGLILAAYTALAILYAARTPMWQAPDEPAHFNYVLYLHEQGALPVLRAGDYDQAQLERLKASRFAGNPDVSAVRYESHQPPLYYALGSVLWYALPGEAWPRLLSLRLLSALFGGLVVLAVFAIARHIFPQSAGAPLLAAAFVAFIPQHLAIAAAANNDSLGELLLSLMALLAVVRLRTVDDRRHLLLAGVLLGLAFLTKLTAYAGAVILAAGELGRLRLAGRRDGRRWLGALSAIALAALVVGGWWFVRNALVYGPTDLVGLQNHDAVVVGQPRTALNVDALRHFAGTMFQSFWGMFGWMGVLIDARLYALLALLTGMTALGLALFAAVSWRALEAAQRWALGLLILLLALTGGQVVVYNLAYIQPQGRYLFPAGATIGVFFAVGLYALARRPALLAAALLAGGVLLFMAGYGGVFLVLGGLLAAAVALVARLPALRRCYPAGLLAALVVALIALDVVCLFWYIVPALS